jgi:hypothetical protein
MADTLFIPNAIEELPHWARVAFAARCARRALALFHNAWPDADPEHSANLEAAVTLAEQSANTGALATGVDRAIPNAICVAGAALMPVLVSPEEPGPADEDKCYIASFCAKSAEWAGKAAQDSPPFAAQPAREAYTFARDAATRARVVRLLVELESDFEAVYHHAKDQGWNHTSPVPPSAFDTVPEKKASRDPWWKFWGRRHN